jgi:choline dehydrogenase-like flavoprotein
VKGVGQDPYGAVVTYSYGSRAGRAAERGGDQALRRIQEAAGAQQIFLAGQPFAPGQRGADLEAFIEKVNQLPIGPGGTPVFSAHQMCSVKLGSDPHTCVAKPDGELHDTTGVWIAARR